MVNQKKYHPANLILTNKQLKCKPCPIEATCKGNIQSLPNYWGYKDQFNVVSMIRCPTGYCCQGDEACKGIDSCNNHRTGRLCGMCQTNWTESLFSPGRLLIDYCAAGLILVLYILCVILYGLGLLAFNYIKDVGVTGLKNWCRNPRKKKCVPEVSCELKKLNSEGLSERKLEETSVQKNSPAKIENESFRLQLEHRPDEERKVDKEDDAMKYIQILFYYVQDAALFKIKLPGQGQQDESIVVQMLQFSPEVLATLYANIMDHVFQSGNNCSYKVHVFISVWTMCNGLYLSLVPVSKMSFWLY